MLVHKEQLQNFDFTGMICIELLKKDKEKKNTSIVECPVFSNNFMIKHVFKILIQ
jgi:hypothetical protein